MNTPGIAALVGMLSRFGRFIVRFNARTVMATGLLLGFALFLRGEETAPPGQLPQLDGIMHIGKESYALFKGYDPSGHRWAVAGEDVGDFTVEKVGGVTVTLVGPDKHKSEVYVTGWRSIEKRQHSPIASEEWINSPENPMVWHPVSVPVQLQIRLGDLTPDEKYAMQQWYLSYGWRMSFVIDAMGYWDIGFEHAYGDARERKLNTQIARFRASLSPEQARAYTELTKAIDYATYRATQTQRAQRMADFIATLSPAQRKAFEGLQNVDGSTAIAAR